MKLSRIFLAFILVIAVQCGIYYYIDGIVLAPIESFNVGDNTQALKIDASGDGEEYYSYDRRFLAKVTDDQVAIYERGKEKEPQYIDLKGAKVSFFEWLPDRNLAVFATYGRDSGTKKYGVYIKQYNPLMPDHETAAQLEDVPVDSKIVDAVYSTATNVVYMKLKVGEDRYRIYRTDANYDTRRIYVQAENIGKIAVFPDKDVFLYDNLKTGVVYMFQGTTGGWRTISPAGKFRLVGVADENIFLAKYDGKDHDSIVAAYRGKLGVGFEKIIAYDKPENFSNVTLDSFQNM